MPYELFVLNYFLLSAYRQTACVQPSLPDVHNSADGYRILAAKKNYPKGLNWIKNREGRNNE